MTAEVKNCAVQQCFYNCDEICRASAILIGSDHPACDTYIDKGGRHGTPASISKVGACHESDCKFNEQLSCCAPSINVDHHDSHADCATFDPQKDTELDTDVKLSGELPDIIFEGSRNPRATEEIEE